MLGPKHLLSPYVFAANHNAHRYARFHSMDNFVRGSGGGTAGSFTTVLEKTEYIFL